MQLASVNIGKKIEKPWRDGTVTAIHKAEVDGSVVVLETGIEGDQQADLRFHGGEDKAVLVLPSSAYQRFEINRPYGYLGENLTIDGIDEAEICLGDRLQIGMTLLEVTQPRSPCWKLDAQAVDASGNKQGSFLKKYSESGHVGFYCRVIARGSVKAEQQVIWLTRNQGLEKQFPKISIKELFLAKQYRKTEQAWKTIEQATKHPALSKDWRDELLAIIARRQK